MNKHINILRQLLEYYWNKHILENNKWVELSYDIKEYWFYFYISSYLIEIETKHG